MIPNSVRATSRRAATAAALLALACAEAPTDPATLAAPREPLTAKGGSALPDRYVLPGATVYPEGIAYDQRSGTVYVGSTTDGAIYSGDVRDETLEIFLAGNTDGRTFAAGLAVDAEGRLYVSGGGTGKLFVYDAGGALLATFATGSSPSFINDVAVAKDGSAYFTDSQSPYLYRVYQNDAGQWTYERWIDFTGTPLVWVAGFNVNGIDVTPNGKYLIVVQSNTGKLFRIDTETKEVTPIDLGGATVPGGDGILLQGSTLWVVQNSAGLLTEIRLNVEAATGEVIARTTDPSFAFPTTLTDARGRLLVVNSQFNRRGPGLAPTLPFTVSVIKRP
jgi:sugar lactone lactonase YvrE